MPFITRAGSLAVVPAALHDHAVLLRRHAEEAWELAGLARRTWSSAAEDLRIQARPLLAGAAHECADQGQAALLAAAEQLHGLAAAFTDAAERYRQADDLAGAAAAAAEVSP